MPIHTNHQQISQFWTVCRGLGGLDLRAAGDCLEALLPHQQQLSQWGSLRVTHQSKHQKIALCNKFYHGKSC